MFPIFITPKKGYSVVGKILLGSLIVVGTLITLTLLVALYPPLFRYKDLIMQSTFRMNLLFIGLLVCCALYYVFVRAKKKWEPAGEMKFLSDGIAIAERKILFSEIQSVRFIGNDILGDFRGQVSTGQNNSVRIVLRNGEELRYNFLQTPEQNLRAHEDYLRGLETLNLLSKANLDSILNNTNYY